MKICFFDEFMTDRKYYSGKNCMLIIKNIFFINSLSYFPQPFKWTSINHFSSFICLPTIIIIVLFFSLVFYNVESLNETFYSSCFSFDLVGQFINTVLILRPYTCKLMMISLKKLCCLNCRSLNGNCSSSEPLYYIILI